MSADGSALFVGTSGERSGVTKIDTDTFEVVRTWTDARDDFAVTLARKLEG